MLSDPDRSIGLDYHAAIDPDQARADRITYVIGPDRTIQAAISEVNQKTHATDILAILETVSGGDEEESK